MQSREKWRSSSSRQECSTNGRTRTRTRTSGPFSFMFYLLNPFIRQFMDICEDIFRVEIMFLHYFEDFLTSLVLMVVRNITNIHIILL
jgi:hypothetical protein